jgi:hypothetical protein
MTFDEKIIQLKTDRSNAINSKVSILAAQANALDEDIFNNKFLWGDGTDNGIQQLYKLYLEEKNIEKGRTFTHPSLANYIKGTSSTGWEGELNTAISTIGDSPNGFYNSGALSTILDMNAYWINTNGEGTENLGFIALAGQITTDIAAALLSWGPTEKANLLASITALRTNINSSSSYQTKLTAIYNEVNDILTGGNLLYTEAGMTADVYDDRTGITTLKSTLDTYCGSSGDLYAVGVGPYTLYGFYNYYNGIPPNPPPPIPPPPNLPPPPPALQSFTDLGTLITNITSTINTRFSSIDTNSFGPVYPTTYTKLRKWRFFWINSRIGKPLASLINYNGMSGAITNANTALANANMQLDVILGTANREEYIPTPTLFVAFENHIRNDASVITQRRTGIAYDGQQHATEYKIYRRTVTSTPLSNAQWGDSEYDSITLPADINPDTGFLKNIYTDEDVGFAIGQKFCYRIRTRDTVNDSFSSGSEESKVYDDTTTYTFTNIVAGKFSIIEADHKIKPGMYIIILGTTVNGFYRVLTVNNASVTVDQAINYTGAGTVNPANSVVFITE